MGSGCSTPGFDFSDITIYEYGKSGLLFIQIMNIVEDYSSPEVLNLIHFKQMVCMLAIIWTHAIEFDLQKVRKILIDFNRMKRCLTQINLVEMEYYLDSAVSEFKTKYPTVDLDDIVTRIRNSIFDRGSSVVEGFGCFDSIYIYFDKGKSIVSEELNQFSWDHFMTLVTEYGIVVKCLTESSEQNLCRAMQSFLETLQNFEASDATVTTLCEKFSVHSSLAIENGSKEELTVINRRIGSFFKNIRIKIDVSKEESLIG
jgi:hypothetical protein